MRDGAETPADPVPPGPTPVAGVAGTAPGWRAALGVLAVALGVLLLLFRETVATTAGTWWSTASYNHGLLVPLVVLVLAWDMRGRLRPLPPRPSLLGLVPMALASVLWTGGALVSVVVVQQLALVVMIWSLVLTVLGPAITRRLAFPLGFLLFAVPMGDALVPYLQDITAWMVVGILQATGVPVFSDGVYLQTAFGQFEVAEACAGLRFLTANVAFCVVLAWFLFRDTLRRVVFVLAGVAVAVVANGLRAYGIVMLAKTYGAEAAVGVDHLIYGRVFFSLVMAVTALIGWTLRQSPEPREAPAETVGETSSTRWKTPRGVVLPVLALAVAAALPAWTTNAVMARSADPDGIAVAPPVLPAPAGWRAVEPIDAWAPAFAGADAVLHTAFADAAGTAIVDRVVAWYPKQTQGREVASGEHDLPGAGWRRLSLGHASVAAGSGTAAVQAMTIKGDRQRNRLVWFWYWVDGARTDDAVVAKLLQARSLMAGGDGAGAVIAVSAPYADQRDLRRAETALRAFLAAQPDLSRPLAVAAAPPRP